uniref:Uncharacterized protein n=1 Tax=Nymphaea colorata TaxID=210225 RepID=A0A5K0V5F1_9MAGN
MVVQNLESNIPDRIR